MPQRYVFRDLPGIAELTRINAIENLWSPERDNFEEKIDAESKRLFGVTLQDCFDLCLTVDTEEDASALGLNYRMLFNSEYEEQLPVWDLLGWDVTDGAGDQHPLLGHFAMQIITATKGLGGHLPDETPPEDPVALAEQAAGWGASLEDAARAFMQKRGRR